MRLWDVESGQRLGAPLKVHNGSTYSVALNPDGKRLASWSGFAARPSRGFVSHVRLWDVASGQPLGASLKVHDGEVSSVAFSPDGKRLASVGYWTDGSARFGDLRLWDVESGLPLGAPLKGHDDSVSSVAFSPDGKRLASASEDTTVRLWDVDPHSWQQRACAIANRSLTQEEWRQYMGDLPYHKTCPDLPGPDDAPQAAAIQTTPGTGKAPSAESASAPTEVPGPAVNAPPVIRPQSEKPTAPAPVQEGDPVEPVDGEDRARFGPTPVEPVSPVPPASENRKEPVKSPAGP